MVLFPLAHERNPLLVILVFFLSSDLHALALQQTQGDSTYTFYTFSYFVYLPRKHINSIDEFLVQILEVTLLSLLRFQNALNVKGHLGCADLDFVVSLVLCRFQSLLQLPLSLGIVVLDRPSQG